MRCPVCDSSAYTEISGGWHDRKVARCDECGNIFDHLFDQDGGATSQTVNCPECGSPNPGSRDACSYCGAPLDGPAE